MASMYHWLRLDHTKHPHYPHKSLGKIKDGIFHCIGRHKTLVVKGSWFRPRREKKLQSISLRATYAAAPFDQVQEAIERLVEAITETLELS